jgi:glycosyltransferase involved in cell wall biosynthesis
VVIPVFNGAERARRAVASVVGQPGPRVEVVVVDDGSTEDLGELLSELRRLGLRIIRSMTNQGPAAARNLGARATGAEWLIFLDSDDLMLPGGLSILAGEVDEACGLVRASVETRDYEGRAVLKTTFLPGTFAVRRTIFERAGGYDSALRFGENSELLIRLQRALADSAREARVVAAPTVLMESVGKSRNYDQARMHAAIHILTKHHDALASGKERAQYAAIAAVNASRLRKWDVAREYSLQAIRSDPRRVRHYVRYAVALFGPCGGTVSSWYTRVVARRHSW